MIAVVCKETIKEGMEKQFVESMQEMIDLTKKEQGNIAYDLYEAKDGSGIIMVEMWESMDALDAHMKSEHFGRLIPQGDKYKAAPTQINLYEKVSK
jgi:quinol monooxygenase YgiN